MAHPLGFAATHTFSINTCSIKICTILMTPSQTTPKRNIRQLHRFLAPIMVLPLILTAITGSIFQVFDLAGQEESAEWLLHIHKGHFGPLNLAPIYPFLNALGLLALAVTGISMWMQQRSRSHR
jgi:uncharacterized iron-regulated membrane protein